MTELVSIIIPAYNAEKWIKDTIKSALSQTWPKKEIIIVDDGSSDNTLHVARQFESKLVKVITQRNMGACSARNKALSFAQGDYIQWLDADDLLAPDKISQQLKKSDSGQNALILLTSAYGKFFYRLEKAEFKPDALWQDLEPVEWLVIKLMQDAWMNPATWLVSRRLTELAGQWDERLLRDQDGEYFCRLVCASEKVKFVKEAKCFYRIGNIHGVSMNEPRKIAGSYFLAASLCIYYLRSLENSERTRIACLKYLQNRFYDFYSDNYQFIERAHEIAQALGGTLSPPKLSWKYSLLRIIFGHKMVMYLKWVILKAKLLALNNWDRLLYNLSIE